MREKRHETVYWGCLQTPIIIILLLVLTLIGCKEYTYKGMPQTEHLPFILVAKTINKDSTRKAVIIMDAAGKYYNLAPGYYSSHSLYDSYEKGDTIIFNQQK